MGNLVLFFLKIFESFCPGTGRDRGVCPGTFAPALVPGQRDKKIFFVPGQRDNGTSHPGSPRDVPSLGNPTRNTCEHCSFKNNFTSICNVVVWRGPDTLSSQWHPCILIECYDTPFQIENAFLCPF